MPRKSKNIYMRYTAEALESAVSAVRNGHLSLRKASKKYAVPKTTLIDHVSGRIECGARPGRKPYLAPKIEEALVSKVISAADKGFGISKSQLILKTARLCQSAQIPLQKNVPGDDWWRGLKRRHPELVLRKPERLSTSRVRMLNKPVIDSFFADLNKVVTGLNLQNKPHLVWNADETGKQFEHSPSNVCTKKGTRTLQSRTSNSRENVTILACINATGKAMPPLCVAKGKTRKCLQTFNTVDAPEGTLWTYQNKAWMCDILGDEWFTNVFLKNCGPERPQLLIMDSHSSHEVLSLLEKAKQENIHIMALPPHCTHVLQPLDRTVFGPFNKAYNRLCSEFLAANPNHVVNKASWPRLFNGAWTAAMTTANITKGFKVCGLYPVDGSQIPTSAFLPSSVYDTPLSNQSQLEDGCSADTSLNSSPAESTALPPPPFVTRTVVPGSAIASQEAISQTPDFPPQVSGIDPISASSPIASPCVDEGLNIPVSDIEPLLQALTTGTVSVLETDRKGKLKLWGYSV
ncbi:tigger transposable element-derived protein 6-like [Argopecten irradians]|uniref:tigger transposable element-derived protein 6-like n=1 Tax=Argopecten irradians TaxID=31199 RepID=UPI00371FD00E